MEQEKEVIINKYKKTMENIIKKYENTFDDELDIIDVFDFEDNNTISSCEEAQSPFLLIENISFIKNDTSLTKNRIDHKNFSNKKILLFQDIYKMLCSECDFDDIYHVLIQ